MTASRMNANCRALKSLTNLLTCHGEDACLIIILIATQKLLLLFVLKLQNV